VTGARRGERPFLGVIRRSGFNGQRHLPIAPVAIFDADRYGSSDGFAVINAAEEFGCIAFNSLARSPAEAQLAGEATPAARIQNLPANPPATRIARLSEPDHGTLQR